MMISKNEGSTMLGQSNCKKEEGKSVIALCYLRNERIDKHVSVPVHFRRLSGMIDPIPGVMVKNIIIKSSVELQKMISMSNLKILYIIAHSDASNGLQLMEDKPVSGERIGRFLSSTRAEKPQIIFFNTCNAFNNGIVDASLKAGINTVIASEKTIPIKFMSSYGEHVFRCWIDKEMSLAGSIESANEAFTSSGVQFQIFGNKIRSIDRYLTENVCRGDEKH